MNGRSNLSLYHSLTALATAACFLVIVDGAVPQLQMHLFGGQLLSNSFTRIALFGSLAVCGWLRPRIELGKFPTAAWMLLVVFLVVDLGYFQVERNLNIVKLLQSYNGYYALLLAIPAMFIFRGAVPEEIMIRLTLGFFLICAGVGIAQYLLVEPLLYTESTDGRFVVQSWQFFGSIRAFSLFSSAMKFGIFCSLCGALGVAMSRQRPSLGISVALLSALACYTTLTRNCYLIFICACTYSAITTFGKKASRGFWQPLVYLMLGITTLVFGLVTFVPDSDSELGSALSLIERIVEWTYYSGLILRASVAEAFFGLGMFDYDLRDPMLPAAIDNMPLTIALHIGIIGMVLYTLLWVKLWFYLRHEALVRQQPFITAGASVWATLACAGLFNTIFGPYEIVLCLMILCGGNSSEVSPSESVELATA